ncbi:hypothetical protein HII31_01267 [Pseudocercospora fuligena]|uniref:Uncharacterized protein n=1 Tax=Pseudocercospora fuligena TaxID=685502 RepID=A0A8H6VP56_9PEZI|nr:hypothetical protein HII31_01267 [Pseudocercospora fuligena]
MKTGDDRAAQLYGPTFDDCYMGKRLFGSVHESKIYITVQLYFSEFSIQGGNQGGAIRLFERVLTLDELNKEFRPLKMTQVDYLGTETDAQIQLRRWSPMFQIPAGKCSVASRLPDRETAGPASG